MNSSLFETVTFEASADQAIVDNLIKYAVAPRPICFASTIDSLGHVNLSPFSYFNLMSHQPPICVFSPLRRMRDGSTKHTLDNLKEVNEVVINIVNYAMVQQQSLASTEYAKEVDEFDKSGLTPIPSLYIRPPRVAESPVQLECNVREIIALSDKPGAGNLVIAEVLYMHVHKTLLQHDNTIKQEQLDLVARLGGDWYSRVSSENLFIVPKPLRSLGIGVDQLPESIRLSTVLTGNHLGMLANVESLPRLDHIQLEDKYLRYLQLNFQQDAVRMKQKVHEYAAQLLDKGQLEKAWQVLLSI
ncbi:flavin reductase family protein [Sphingobacterium thalpophilum]|uniref:Flavin reductase family protein n=1 Tax=Sphingobacterium thalpophilum TaxID=259 RepID=A0A4U9VHB7_9SPHI|nr:flavin reductase family protein [Sphingobacterium thalpophilum]VTR45483.1 Flavin reductase like domain [Sphingobacterium thalpophilum]